MSKFEDPIDVEEIKAQIDGFEKWFLAIMSIEGSTALIRDVLRKNKNNLRATWMEVRPMEVKSDLK